MNRMFSYASSFNQPLASWNVSALTDMSFMFYDASSFNQPLDSWNVSAVTDMSAVFASGRPGGDCGDMLPLRTIRMVPRGRGRL
jgi:surface protein